jgi:hypothetical protein
LPSPEAAGALLAGHLARIGFEVCELLDPAYEPGQLGLALLDAGAEVPARLARRQAAREHPEI